MALVLPEKFKKERPQFHSEIDNSLVTVFYDDEASKISEVNQYAVFSKRGFHGWVELGFTMMELLNILEFEATDDYDAEFNKLVKL